MIITRILGGLGNQMFQYAIGRSLALASGQQLKLDLMEMNRYTLHSFQIDQFNINADVASHKEIPFGPRNSRFGKIVNSIKNRNRALPVIEKGLLFDPKILEIRNSVHLTGYWQTEKYFSKYSDIIRQDFALRQPFSQERLVTLARIRDVERSVSVHVRRGDYVSDPKANNIHGTCAPEWYAAVMAEMARIDNRATFFIFSDDPAWARNNLPVIGEMVFVEPQSDGRDGEDMHLMAACHSHIIANSTFSWWGAWLNPRKDKHVIAPANWFRSDRHDDRDLVPGRWLRL